MISAAADLERIVTLGLLAMFGSVPVMLPFGWLVARRAGFEGGAAVVLLVFGIAAAAAAVWLAIHVHVQSVVVMGTRASCEVLSDGTARERYTFAADHAVRGVAVVPALAGACERTPDEPVRLRVRKTLTADVEVAGRVEEDRRQAYALIGVFGAFGGFGLLSGLFFAVTTARRHRPAMALDERALSPRRQRLGQGFTIAGNLSMVGCALTAAFADLSAVRSGVLVFGGAAAACVSFAIALVAKRALALDAALILVIVGGGCALAALSLWYLG